MKVVHITDPHFNFRHKQDVVLFGEQVRGTCLQEGIKHVVMTGDLSESRTLERDLGYFGSAFTEDDGISVHYVLGNHDFYKGGITETKWRASQWKGYLESKDYVPLDEDTALCGVDGWYDFRSGSGPGTKLGMHDWDVIRELKDLTWVSLVDSCRGLAKDSAKKATKKLELAMKAGYKQLVLATHVPPFRQAAWHAGAVSDDTWLPVMTNMALGDALVNFTSLYPGITVDVLCGHTHTARSVEIAKNLNVHAGHAEYGQCFAKIQSFPL